MAFTVPRRSTAARSGKDIIDRRLQYPELYDAPRVSVTTGTDDNSLLPFGSVLGWFHGSAPNDPFVVKLFAHLHSINHDTYSARISVLMHERNNWCRITTLLPIKTFRKSRVRMEHIFWFHILQRFIMYFFRCTRLHIMIINHRPEKILRSPANSMYQAPARLGSINDLVVLEKIHAHHIL